MMHESRLWVVHLMIKVLRIRLLEVLVVVHLRHRVEETIVIVVVVLLLLMRWLISARRRRLRRRRRMEAQLLHIFVLLCCVVSPKRKNKATFEMERQRDKKNGMTLLFLPFFQRITCGLCLKSGRKKQKKRGRYLLKIGEELPGTCLIPGSHPLSYIIYITTIKRSRYI